MIGHSKTVLVSRKLFFQRPIKALSPHTILHLPRPTLSHSQTYSSSSISDQCSPSTFQWNSPNMGPLLSQMSLRQNPKPGRSTYLFLLKTSAALSSQRLVISIYCHILKAGFQEDIIIATTLVDVLCQCSEVHSAYKVFEAMPKRDVAAWNAMLSGYSRHGFLEHALCLFCQMGLSDAAPNSFTLSILLKLCSNFDLKMLGRCIHSYVIRNLGIGDTFFHNSLLVYYNRCGDIHTSYKLFERMLERDLVSWNAMISGYALNGYPGNALESFHSLRDKGLCPDLVTLETTLQACAQIGNGAIKDGESIHALLVQLGYPVNVRAENSLLLMYCKCGGLESGQCLFDKMETRNLVSWNILIDGHVRAMFPERALVLFNCVHCVESDLSCDLIVSALQAIKQLRGCPEQVMPIHCLVLVLGVYFDGFVRSSLVSAYGECGEAAVARTCFDYMSPGMNNTRVCWNTMLSVYVHNGFFHEAAELLNCMQAKGCTADEVTIVNALSVCTQLLDLKLGKTVHGYVIRNKFESNIFVTTALLEFYINWGSLSVACWLFSMMSQRNTASWNTMIHGCYRRGFPRASLKLFHLMQQQDNAMPDATTIVGVIEAIALRGNEREGKYIHEYAIQAGYEKDEFVANCLISMYARFHNFDRANMVFDRIAKPRTATWNVIISEYSLHGILDKAISTFHLMKLNNVPPDAITLLSLLPACAQLASLNSVMWIHTIICKAGFQSDLFVGTSLIDTYAKCGGLSMARMVFDNMKSKSTISWNSMIYGYGTHGKLEEAEKLFFEMLQFGLNPDAVTFLILMFACSHAGDLEKCRHYLDLMTRVYLLSPGVEHYSCYADLLARTGLVKEAAKFLEKNPANHGISAWGAILGACRVQGNMELGLVVAKKLFELDPLHCGYSVLVSNIYSELGRWTDKCVIRRKLSDMGSKKVHGWSIVET